MPIRNYKRVNADGSRNVWCSQCFHYIGSVNAMTAINTAICAVCQADNAGEELTVEQVAQLRAVRIGENTVSHAVAFPEQVLDPMKDPSMKESEDLESHSGRVGYSLKALVVAVVRAGVETAKETILASKQVAKDKKRRRIFEQPIDPE